MERLVFTSSASQAVIIVMIPKVQFGEHECFISMHPNDQNNTLSQIGILQVSKAQGIGSMRKGAVKLTDARIRTVQEILSGVRVVKYNGWTTAFLARIEQLRSVEMRWIKKGAYIRASNSALRVCT